MKKSTRNKEYCCVGVCIVMVAFTYGVCIFKMIGVSILLGVIIVSGIMIKVLLWYKKKKIQKRKELVTILYGTENLLSKLGRTNLIFPIRCSGGQWAETISIRSLKSYTKQYFFGSQLSGGPATGVGAETIVDKTGAVYKTYRVTMQDLGYADPQVSEMEFEGVSTTGESINFETIKEQILDEIYTNPSSAYSGLEQEIKQAKSMEELDSILSQGSF